MKLSWCSSFKRYNILFHYLQPQNGIFRISVFHRSTWVWVILTLCHSFRITRTNGMNWDVHDAYLRPSKTMFGAFSFRKNWPKKIHVTSPRFVFPIPSAICSVPWHHTLQICGVGLHMFLPGLVCGVVEPIISRKNNPSDSWFMGVPICFPICFPIQQPFSGNWRT